MNILVFTDDYPYKRYNNQSFVKQLIDQFAAQGNICVVISPWPVFRKKGWAETEVIETNENGGMVKVLRPNYLTVPHVKIGRFYPSQWLRESAVRKAISMLKEEPDVVYCHFWRQGLVALPYVERWHKPLFVASGESEIASLVDMSKITERFKNQVKGVVCVSSKSKKESIKLGLTTEKKCIVLPNAININKFHKIDKGDCRKKLGLPFDKFIVCFVGWFIERKGPLRVAQAIERIGDKSIGSIFIGEGEQSPSGSHILFKGSVLHDQLKYYLNASDVFVLPTLNEGCCNAIVEALACGLPVISSDLDFNRDILNSSNSIQVNPMNIDEIAKAISRVIYNNSIRLSLSAGALATAANLTINKRAEKIIEFFKHNL